MIFPGISYSYHMWYMGTWLVSYMVVRKVLCSPLERCDTKLIVYITQRRDALPGYGNRTISQSLKKNINMQ